MIVKYIVVHCSDSDLASHDNIETIDKWHRLNGWKGIGYHYFIDKSGGIYIGRQEYEIGAHCKGFNDSSISICLSGKSDFTDKQFASAKKLIKNLCEVYDLDRMHIIPHNQLNKNKTCPNFDIRHVLN